MKKYIVDGNTDDVPAPYFLMNTGFLMNFSLLYKDKDETAVERLKEKLSIYYNPSKSVKT